MTTFVRSKNSFSQYIGNLNKRSFEDENNDSFIFQSPSVVNTVANSKNFLHPNKFGSINSHDKYSPTVCKITRSDDGEMQRKVTGKDSFLSYDESENCGFEAKTRSSQSFEDLKLLTSDENVSETDFCTLQVRLKSEADKIKKWQMSMESQLDEKAQRLCESQSEVAKLRKLHSDIEIQLYETRQKLDLEVEQRLGVNLQMESTRHLSHAVYEAIESNGKKVTDMEKSVGEVSAILQVFEEYQDNVCKELSTIKTNSIDAVMSSSEKLNSQINELLNCKNDLTTLKDELKLSLKQGALNEDRIVELTSQLKLVNDDNVALKTSIERKSQSLDAALLKMEAIEKENNNKGEEICSKNECLKLLSEKIEEVNGLYQSEQNENLKKQELMKHQNETSLYFEQQCIILLAEKSCLVEKQNSIIESDSAKILDLENNLRSSLDKCSVFEADNVSLKEQIDAQLDKILSLEKRVTGLSEGRNALEKNNENLNQTIKDLKECLLQAKTVQDSMDSESRQLSSTIAELERDLFVLQENLRVKEETIQNLTNQLNEVNLDVEEARSHAESLCEEKTSLQRDFNLLKEESGNMKKTLSLKQSNIISLTGEINTMKGRLSHSEGVRVSLNLNLEQLRSQTESLQIMLNKSQTELESLQVLNSTLHDSNKVLEEKCKKLNLDIERKSTNVSELQDNEFSYKTKIDTLQTSLSELEERFSDVMEQCSKLEKEKEEKVTEIDELDKKLEISEGNKHDLVDSQKSMNSVIAQLRAELDEAKKLSAKKEKMISSLRADQQKSEMDLSAHRQEFNATLEQYASEKEKILAVKDKEIDKLKASAENIKTVRKTTNELKAKLQNTQKELYALQASSAQSEDELKNKNEELYAEIDRLTKLIAEYTAQQKDLQKNLDEEKKLREASEEQSNKLKDQVKNMSEILNAARSESQKNMSPPMKLPPIGIGGEVPRTPRSPGLKLRLGASEKESARTVTPQKTPRGILKTPGSASKRRRVEFGGESTKVMSDRDENDSSASEHFYELDPVKGCLTLTPRKSLTTSNVRRTPQVSSRNQKVFLRRAVLSPGQDEELETARKIRTTPSRLTSSAAHIRRTPTERQNKITKDCWFDSDPVFGLQSIDED